MPEENRVFDVARPGHSSAQANSKPVIVGHQPTITDPMVRTGSSADYPAAEPASTRINVQDQPSLSPLNPDNSPAVVEPGQSAWSGPFSETAPSDQAPAPEFNTAPSAPTVDAPIEPAYSPEAPDQLAHVQSLQVAPPKRKKRLAWIFLIILVLLAGAYLAIDSGLIKTNINLPFHVFKQKTPTSAATQPPAQTPAANTATIPDGFTEYKLAGTTITFAAPTTWGQPTSSSDPGYSSRSATAKSDGTYAYIVDFATNKDVEIAVTSSKYLPPARTALYYDYLQWCTGTSDGKTYLGVLHFTTANKVDTPTTVACDQGPITDATAVDTSTIVELKTKDAAGNVAGDLYTKNLSNTDLPVIRVKDKAMTNGDDIKQLLTTVTAPTAQ